jgi:hypothetical protein
MHLFTALVFAVALYITDANVSNTVATIAGRKIRGWSPNLLAFLCAGAWALFYYLTH